MLARLLALLLLALWHLPAAAERLTVAVSHLPPCVNAEEGELSGFSIDLWQALAHEMGVEQQFTITTLSGKLDAVRSGEADAAIGCISLTAEREAELDFSLPVMDAGFRAVSQVDSGLIPSFSSASRQMLMVLLGALLLFAHLMWWSERGSSAISDRYLPGVLEAFWFCIVTMSTVGYGDIAPRRWLGRLSATLVILTGVTAFGIIFGQFAADAMADRARYPVTSPLDLRNYRVATKEATAAAHFLRAQGVETVDYGELEQAYAALLAGEVELVLFDAPAIDHFTQRHQGEVIATGPLFQPHYYAIALPHGSHYRETIDHALLTLQHSGLLQTIQQRWFGP